MVKQQPVEEQAIDKQANGKATSNLTPAQEALQDLWEEHMRYEFATHNTEDALTTITGIRRVYWCNSAYSILIRCPLSALAVRGS